MNIQQLIEEIDEKREKATKGEWHEEEFGEFREDCDIELALLYHNSYDQLREAALAGEKVVQHLKDRLAHWSLDNHHCVAWRHTPEDEKACGGEGKWHGYCGFEMDHGVEARYLQGELSDALHLYREAIKD